jgi:hypothetical protein
MSNNILTREEQRASGDAIRKAADSLLLENASVFESLRQMVEPVHTSMANKKRGQQRSKRPSVSQRLLMTGEPTAKLVILPNWRHPWQDLVINGWHLEMLTEVTKEVEGESCKNWKRRFTMRYAVSNCAPQSRRIYFASAVEDAKRVIATVREFNEDSGAVLARCHDSCCICGRSLTDELSRARGIGPECIRYAPECWWLTNRSICQAELSTAAN